MTRMVEDLLLLARAQGHAITFIKDEVEVSSVLEELQRQVSVPYSDKKIKLNLINKSQRVCFCVVRHILKLRLVIFY